VRGTEGGTKLEVSMKKIRSKNTTSINGAMSIESVARLGRANMASGDGGEFVLQGLERLDLESGDRAFAPAAGLEGVVEGGDGEFHAAGDFVGVALEGVVGGHAGNGDNETEDGGEQRFPNAAGEVGGFRRAVE